MKLHLGLLSALLLLACSGTPDTPPPPPVCLNVSGELDAHGLKIRKPEEPTDGCTKIPGANEDESLCQQKKPDLSCLAHAEPLGTPINVTYTGCVASFGLDASGVDLAVTVLRESAGGNRTDPGYDLAAAPGITQGREKTPAAWVGSTVSTMTTRERCVDLGTFSLQGVPTETQFIIRVTDQHYPKAERKYVDTYQYNVVLRNNAIRMGPLPTDALVSDPASYCAANECFVVDDVNTVYEVTFTTVAITAGVSNIMGDDDLYDGMGQGHVAGEVQDCTSLDRLQNAIVSLDARVRKLAYFNVGQGMGIGNLENPRVDQSRTRTNADGLYAAIAVDTAAGGQEVHVGAAITTSLCGDDGVCMCLDGAANAAWTAADSHEAESVVLGDRNIYVYPDSITILTFDRTMYTAP